MKGYTAEGCEARYGFLAGRKGAFYVAGATSDGTIPCPEDTPKWKTACYGPWRVTDYVCSNSKLGIFLTPNMFKL